MSKTVLFDTDRNELVELDSKQEKLYNEYLEYDKHVGMFETMFSISDALSNNLITITKDNIHLYYKCMSDEDLIKYKVVISDVLDDRIVYITRVLKNVSFSNFEWQGLNGTGNISCAEIVTLFEFGNWFLKSSLFGIKDTLEPIDKYIEEIKESSEYKEYIY